MDKKLSPVTVLALSCAHSMDELFGGEVDIQETKPKSQNQLNSPLNPPKNQTKTLKQSVVAVVDPFTSGHHLLYVDLIVNSLVSMKKTPLVLSGDIEFLKTSIDKSDSGIEPIYEEFTLGTESFDRRTKKYAFHVLKRWFQLGRILRKIERSNNVKVDCVILPWLDTYISRFLKNGYLKRVFPYSWAGIIIQPVFVRGGNQSRVKPLSFEHLANSSQCLGVGFLMDSAVERFQDRTTHPHKVAKIPDYVDTSLPDKPSDLVQELERKAKGRTIVGLFGSISKRKGILKIIESIERTGGYEDLFFVIAGQFIGSTFTEYEASRIQSVTDKHSEMFLFIRERLPSELDFNALIQKSDLIYAAYDYFPYSSNMLGKAAFFNKPLIATEGSYIAAVTQRYSLGVGINTRSPAAVDNFFGNLNENRKFLASISSPQLRDQYLAENSSERLRQALEQFLSSHDRTTPSTSMY